MKVVLLTPPYDKNRFRLGESLGIKYLAAMLRKNNFEADILEPTLEEWDVVSTLNKVLNGEYNIVGISVQFSHGLKNALEIARRVKAVTNGHVTIGGGLPKNLD